MSKIIIQGIKFDEKSSFQKGSRLAPPLIREALNCGSHNLFAENGISIENSMIEDKGDFDISKYFDIEEITRNHIDFNDKIFRTEAEKNEAIMTGPAEISFVGSIEF